MYATPGGDGDTVIAADTLISFHHTLLVGNVADKAGGAFFMDDWMIVPGTFPKAHITMSLRTTWPREQVTPCRVRARIGVTAPIS